MRMNVAIDDAELLTRLMALETKIRKKVLGPALRKGAKIVLREEKATAPRRTGALAKDFKVRAAGTRASRKFRVSVEVKTAGGAYKGDRFYGAFPELGWKTGPRNWRGRKRFIFKTDDGRFTTLTRRRQIPGRHFTQHAFDAKAQAAQAAIVAELKAGIERVAATNAKE